MRTTSGTTRLLPCNTQAVGLHHPDYLLLKYEQPNQLTPLLSQVKSFKVPFQIPSTTPATYGYVFTLVNSTPPSVHNQTSLLEPELLLLPAQWPACRVSTLRLGHCGFDPQTSHPKDYEMVPTVSLLDIQYLGLDFGMRDHPMVPKHGS